MSRVTKQTINRTVIDVSDLIAWQGNLSGIQRMVAEMAYRYEKAGALFCYYNEESRAFFPLESFTGLMNKRQHVAQPITQHHSVSKSSRYADIRSIAHQISPPILVRVAKKSKHILVGHKTSARVESMDIHFRFNKNDTLLIFGAHWDKPHYTEVLSNLKAEHSLRIGHTVYDLIPIVDRAHVAEVEHVRFPLYIEAISRISDIIYVISESTKKDYIHFLKTKNIASPKIKVLILGEDFTSTQSIKPAAAALDSPYLLMVGTVEVRKNHALLYGTYKRAHEQGIELPSLIIAGRQGWLSGDIYFQMTHDSQVRDKFIFIHDANDHQLAWLYEHCLFTVFSSYYEGWGLPVAEAAYYGKTCAASNTSSIPEVAGKGAVYFSPYSTDECLAAIRTLLDDKNRAVHEKIIKNRHPATWDATFLQSKDIL